MDKYCKNKRCSMDKSKPCPVFDDCDFGIWDIDRQKGQTPTPIKTPIGKTKGDNHVDNVFFKDKWEILFPRLAGLAEYYRRRGCPSSWVFDTVNPNDFGCVQVSNGKYGHKSECPYFEFYYLHGHMASVKCKRITELIPGGVQHLYCEVDFKNCPLHEAKNTQI